MYICVCVRREIGKKGKKLSELRIFGDVQIVLYTYNPNFINIKLLIYKVVFYIIVTLNILFLFCNFFLSV